jgi:hypothetical protein
VCLLCHEKGHFSKRCPYEQCVNCKEYGHGFRDCYVWSYLMRVNGRICRDAAVVENVVIHTVIVPKGAVKHAANPPIDVTNVVHE